MQRTKTHKGNGSSQQGPKMQALEQRLQNLSMLVARAELLSGYGSQYGGDRDIYEALGYKIDLTWDDYYVKYHRQDIASAIIDRPVEAAWRGGLSVLEVDDDKETAFEKEWKALEKRLKLKGRFQERGLQDTGHWKT